MTVRTVSSRLETLVSAPPPHGKTYRLTAQRSPAETYASTEYPYARNYVTTAVLRARMKLLSRYEPVFENRTYSIKNMPSLKPHERCMIDEGTGALTPVVHVTRDDDYLLYSDIAVVFTEEARVRARRRESELTPLELWNANREEVMKLAEKKAEVLNRPADAYAVHETLFDITTGKVALNGRRFTAEVSTFKPTNLVAIARLFNSRRMLDFSAGWGDRLVGAIALDMELYVGVDPNGALFDGYADIVERFEEVDSVVSKSRRTTYTTATGRVRSFINSPFEKVSRQTLKAYGGFDLVFTSPPYFDLEVYSDESSQSTSNAAGGRMDALERWYSSFLMPSIEKAWSVLDEAGVMVLVINDPPYDVKFPNVHYVEQMISDVNRFVDSRYLGVIAYASVRGNDVVNSQPMWMWRKVQANVLRSPANVAAERFVVVNTLKEAAAAKAQGARMVGFSSVEVGVMMSLGVKVIVGLSEKRKRRLALLLTNSL